jgi:hypothetical protein
MTNKEASKPLLPFTGLSGRCPHGTHPLNVCQGCEEAGFAGWRAALSYSGQTAHDRTPRDIGVTGSTVPATGTALTGAVAP